MEIISRTEQVARKEHKCNWCCQKINKGEKYVKTFCKADYVYVWKNHFHCEEIASKLKMFDHCNEEGLDDENFCESIRDEYIKLMEHHNSEIFNYDGFQYPEFKEQLKYVCKMHEIKY